MRWTGGLFLAFCTACLPADDGSGTVTGRFSVKDCRPSGDFEAQDYGYEASWLDTDRFENVLMISVQEHLAGVEEVDGLRIRIPDIAMLREQPLPIVAEISSSSASVDVALSLFETCPKRPQLHAVQGRLELTAFEIQEKPQDTGVDELIVGTLTASLAAQDPTVPVGWVRADFRLEPGPLSVADPQNH